MKPDSSNASEAIDDEVLRLLVGELRRLTTDLARGISRRQVLPCLSSLAAMKPLQAILTDALSGRILEPSPVQEGTQPDPQSFPGYV